MNETQQSISTIIKGLGIYIIASVVTTIITIIGTLTAVGGAAIAIASGNETAAVGAILGGVGVVGILSIVVALAVLYGLYVYYTGLQKFATALDAAGSAAVKNLSYGALLMLIAAALGAIGVFVPFIGGLIAGLCSIAAFILNIIGYSSLQKSSSLNELGVAGAKQLFMGFIFAIIAACCGWIPVIGWIGGPVLYILYWIYLFQGWGKIRASFAQ